MMHSGSRGLGHQVATGEWAGCCSWVCVMAHSGSRGLGHQVATGEWAGGLHDDAQ